MFHMDSSSVNAYIATADEGILHIWNMPGLSYICAQLFLIYSSSSSSSAPLLAGVSM